MGFFNFFKKPKQEHSQKVRSFYNTYHNSFLRAYGDVIQAFRTKDVSIYLDYTLQSAGLEDGQYVLDAGCGVGEPAIYFAEQLPSLKIEGLTVSDKQVQRAHEKLNTNNLFDRVGIRQGDFHHMHEIYGHEQFDSILFLEAFGHSTDKEKLLRSAWEALKPGGSVYIKDLFRRIGFDRELQAKIDAEIKKINNAYHYQISELSDFVDRVRQIGYVIEFIKTIDIDLNEFENLTISNDFQELTGIGRIEDWDNYTFPVDFYEVKLYKPPFDIKEYAGKYFLQVIFKQMQSNQNNS